MHLKALPRELHFDWIVSIKRIVSLSKCTLHSSPTSVFGSHDSSECYSMFTSHESWPIPAVPDMKRSDISAHFPSFLCISRLSVLNNVKQGISAKWRHSSNACMVSELMLKLTESDHLDGLPQQDYLSSCLGVCYVFLSLRFSFPMRVT